MRISKTILVGAVSIAATATVFAQTRVDRAFTATGTSCDQVEWSQEALEDYPQIASACQEVLERNGKYFVLFEGEVERVADRGRQITVNFEEGDRLTLTPPENLSVYIDGRSRSVQDLRPGDQLNFYVPQDQLVAAFYAGDPGTGTAQEVEISPEEPEERVAAADYEPEPMLPGTASVLPALVIAGLLLIALAAGLTFRRRLRG